MTPTQLAGLLADPRRLQILSAVALGASSTDQVAQTIGVSARSVSEALYRLTSAGVVVDDDGDLRIGYDILRELAATARETDDADGDLAPFVEGRRLRSLPAGRDRRWNVLAHVATHALETGRDYSERELVAELSPWCEGGDVDTSALRRYLVEEGLVSRGGGIYRLGSDGPPLSPGEQILQSMGLD